MASNFAFLQTYWPDFAKTLEYAENYAYSDPVTSKGKSGLFVEGMVEFIFQIEQEMSQYWNNLAERIEYLKDEEYLPSNIAKWCHKLRLGRNKALHENAGTTPEALSLLGFAYHVAVWFMQVYGDGDFEPEEYHEPEEPKKTPDYTRLVLNQERKLEEQEALIAQLKKEREELQALQKQLPPQTQVSKTQRQNASAEAISKIKLTEAQTRELIDEQLRRVGWEADTTNLCFAKGTRPAKGRNIAIAEWPTVSPDGKSDHFADYALFVGLQLVGVIEAKAQHKNIYAVLDAQCDEYASHIKPEHLNYCSGSYGTSGKYQVPFVFATNGRPYLKQLETESGIWFRDLRDHRSKALQGWMSPDGLLEKLSHNAAQAENKLENTPYDFLRDPDGLNFRYYQIEALQAVEGALANGQDNILLAMATGTGKTRTILGMIYRFLMTNRFRRILFLVDRTSLGSQAYDTFSDVKLEDLMPLTDIYNVSTLEENEFLKETRVQVATVQSMVSRIINNETDAMPSVSEFDCIIIDEAHRGYTLDKELAEAELITRDQKDFISKYKSVIEYFDAVHIALTATPALHTKQIFGEPVYTYSYRDAVIDGYLVDYDAPHIIETKLNTQGIHFKKGAVTPLYNPVTKELVNGALLDDELLDFDVEDFNRQVLSEEFNRTVLSEIAHNLDPEGDEKTLIYAATDSHADTIVKILRELYAEQDVPEDAIQKITGSIGDKKRVEGAIKKFKNERFPSIVVTVDLLTTGIDVPEITKLVFLRCVKSRILFEQMLGRATRLCRKINKTHFEIYDAVKVFEHLETVSNMKPVVQNPKVRLRELIDGYAKLEEDDYISFQTSKILAKLHRLKAHLTEKQQERILYLAGMSAENLVDKIRELHNAGDVMAAETVIVENTPALEIFEEGNSDGYWIPISSQEDEITTVHRGYGTGQKPEDYIESFTRFLQENRNTIAGIEIICTRPADLSLADLRSLRMELDSNGFSDQQLNTAIKEITSEDVAADTISLIRRYAIGSVLLSHEERVKNAVTRLKKAHNFSAGELKWIDRMEKFLLNESVLNIDVFNTVTTFRDAGGYNKINKVFFNKLDELVRELNTYLYDDKAA